MARALLFVFLGFLVQGGVAEPQSGSYRVVLQIDKRNAFTISVTNKTGKPVVFSPREDFVVVYHETPQGKKTALTWDGGNAEMKLLTPTDTVRLLPNDTYRIHRPIFVDPRQGIDRAQELKRKGVVYALVKPLRPGLFDSKFRKQGAKWALLDRELRSNAIAVKR